MVAVAGSGRIHAGMPKPYQMSSSTFRKVYWWPPLLGAAPRSDSLAIGCVSAMR